MTTELDGFVRELGHEGHDPVSYTFVTDGGGMPLNNVLGHKLSLRFTGERACIACGRRVRKLYQNGYCFPCVTTLAECDLCMVKPHECHFHLGTCRDESFGESHCMIPHYVYLAFSSDVKVGLTRKGRELTRWVDQGASAAVLLAETPTRKAAGELEMSIARFLPDKTQWRKMLSIQETTAQTIVNLQQAQQRVLTYVQEEHRAVQVIRDAAVHTFRYPRLPDWQVTMKSVSLDKTPQVEGTLCGVKGQYLLFDHGVFHVKKHAGMRVHLSLASE